MDEDLDGIPPPPPEERLEAPSLVYSKEDKKRLAKEEKEQMRKIKAEEKRRIREEKSEKKRIDKERRKSEKMQRKGSRGKKEWDEAVAVAVTEAVVEPADTTRHSSDRNRLSSFEDHPKTPVSLS